MSFYIEMTEMAKVAELAGGFIGEFGGEVTLVRYPDRQHDPVLGKVTPGDPQMLETHGVLLRHETKNIEDKLILTTNRTLIINAAVEPKKSDRPMIGGEYIGQIVDIISVKPDGLTPIVYFLQVRI